VTRRKPSRLTTGRLQLLRLFSTLLASLIDSKIRPFLARQIRYRPVPCVTAVETGSVLELWVEQYYESLERVAQSLQVRAGQMVTNIVVMAITLIVIVRFFTLYGH